MTSQSEEAIRMAPTTRSEEENADTKNTRKGPTKAEEDDQARFQGVGHLRRSLTYSMDCLARPLVLTRNLKGVARSLQ